MSVLIKNVTVLDSNSPYNKKKINILVDSGLISIGSKSEHDNVFDFDDCFVSPGWFDLNSSFCDPGFEYKEDLFSGLKCAESGGFTDVQVIPDTNPVIQTKAILDYLKGRSNNGVVNVHVNCAISKDFKDNELTEIIDLINNGATSFSNADCCIDNPELLISALRYTHAFDLPVFQNAVDPSLSKRGQMHEGLVSTQLGMKGIPSLAEELIIERDLKLLKYSDGGKIHFTKVSSKKGVELIAKAKAQGMNVSADVGIHHLLFTDESVKDFDTVFKSLPPYRSEDDRLALINGVIDGTIDAISSNHRPQDSESKMIEFDLSEPGSISLQTFYSSILSITPEISEEILVDKISNGPRRILNQKEASIKDGEEAKFTIFNPNLEWRLDESSNCSKSINSPFWKKELRGKVVGIYNNNQFSNLL